MPLMDLFWSMLWFFMFFLWIWLLISLYVDIFRSDDLSGWGKAGWVLFMILLPWLGALIYLIARGDGMQERAVAEMSAREQATRQYIQGVASPTSTAETLSKLAALRDQGVLTDAEFEAQKAKALA